MCIISFHIFVPDDKSTTIHLHQGFLIKINTLIIILKYGKSSEKSLVFSNLCGRLNLNQY